MISCLSRNCAPIWRARSWNAADARATSTAKLRGVVGGATICGSHYPRTAAKPNAQNQGVDPSSAQARPTVDAGRRRPRAREVAGAAAGASASITASLSSSAVCARWTSQRAASAGSSSMPGGVASRGSTSASAPGSANSVARPRGRWPAASAASTVRDQRRLRARLAQVELAEAEQRDRWTRNAATARTSASSGARSSICSNAAASRAGPGDLIARRRIGHEPVRDRARELGVAQQEHRVLPVQRRRARVRCRGAASAACGGAASRSPARCRAPRAARRSRRR